MHPNAHLEELSYPSERLIHYSRKLIQLADILTD